MISKCTKNDLSYLNHFGFLKIVLGQKLIKHDAGEAWDPSRKMRLERLVRKSVGINSIRHLWCELWTFY